MEDKKQILEFDQFKDEDVSIYYKNDLSKLVPFDVKRLYFVYSESNTEKERGGHAHINGDQAIVLIKGGVEIILTTQNGVSKTTNLRENTETLLIPKNTWISYTLEVNSILLCLSSVIFEKQESIHSYEKFLASK